MLPSASPLKGFNDVAAVGAAVGAANVFVTVVVVVVAFVAVVAAAAAVFFIVVVVVDVAIKGENEIYCSLN